ncbi:hypothetical protein DASC09_039870 [Saccharomycopsis crataegensis]|uniref:Uncharacterized protein n=1 Tax=Saccharomycopsis crataegensis TaxID=43959 RepID=A0AAV5QPX4_9ASCO|nr:hypothetical protein DASC09_039870 [Saccharomycopsis crataegensis]
MTKPTTSKKLNNKKTAGKKKFASNASICKSTGSSTKDKNKKRQLQSKNSKLIANLDNDLTSIVRETLEGQKQDSGKASSLKDLQQLKEKDTETIRIAEEQEKQVNSDLLQQLQSIDNIKL